MEPTQQHPASGVEALIDRLREQGVQAGKDEASRLVEEAERRADWLVEQARQEAATIRQKAHEEAQRLTQSGEAALKVAARDMQLDVKEMLVRNFSDQIQRLVHQEMNNPEVIRQLVIQIAGKVKRDAGIDESTQMTLKLPETLIGLEELRQNPEEYSEGGLSKLVQSLMREQLMEGVTLATGAERGIKIQLENQHAEIDLTDAAVADLLLKHLQPRFRAILEGVIR